MFNFCSSHASCSAKQIEMANKRARERASAKSCHAQRSLSPGARRTGKVYIPGLHYCGIYGDNFFSFRSLSFASL